MTALMLLFLSMTMVAGILLTLNFNATDLRGSTQTVFLIPISAALSSIFLESLSVYTIQSFTLPLNFSSINSSSGISFLQGMHVKDVKFIIMSPFSGSRESSLNKIFLSLFFNVKIAKLGAERLNNEKPGSPE